jgi:hypothetical protein
METEVMIHERARYDLDDLHVGQIIRAPLWKRLLGMAHTIEIVDGLGTRRVTLRKGGGLVIVPSVDEEE